MDVFAEFALPITLPYLIKRATPGSIVSLSPDHSDSITIENSDRAAFFETLTTSIRDCDGVKVLSLIIPAWDSINPQSTPEIRSTVLPPKSTFDWVIRLIQLYIETITTYPALQLCGDFVQNEYVDETYTVPAIKNCPINWVPQLIEVIVGRDYTKQLSQFFCEYMMKQMSITHPADQTNHQHDQTALSHASFFLLIAASLFVDFDAIIAEFIDVFVDPERMPSVLLVK